jgi:drug/metabolite transporter (DMT)-like permease
VTRQPVHFLPILTTLIAFPFAASVFRRYRQRGGTHLLWWSAGIALYGLGTLTEASVTLLGWHEPLFRAWYIAGALLGAAPLAQGTVYLMLKRRTADRLTMILVPYVAVAALLVLLSPIDLSQVEPHRLSGQVLEWQWVRLFSPLVNTYAFIFLVGGAALSAWRYRGDPTSRHRLIGNCLIAVGALLPGFGGAATRMGHTELLYVTELVGIVLIWYGYRWNVRDIRLPRGTADPRSAEPA